MDDLNIFMKNIENYQNMEEKKDNSHPEMKKESYSSAFLELLNSEIIEDSPKNKKSDKEINFISEIKDNSDELSWNLITDQLMQNQTLSECSEESNEHILTNINDFLKESKVSI